MRTSAKSRKKLTKLTVHYREGTSRRHCGNCAMSHFPQGVCDLVLGRISKGDVCDRWVAK